MLTEVQASGASDALLTAARVRRAAQFEAEARRIPRVYRSRFLFSLPGERQVQLVREARRAGVFTRQAAWFGVCLAGLIALLCYAFSQFRYTPLIWLALPAVAGLSVVFKVVLVQAELQCLLLQELVPASTNGI